jgi:hypothetical protein
VRECALSPAQALELPRAVRERKQSTLDRRQPWWPYTAERYVRERVFPGMSVFEYGGGGSTLWLTDLGAQVTTVEHDTGWAASLSDAAPVATVLLREPDPSGTIPGFDSTGYFDTYVRSIREAEGSFDFVIVDGRARVACVLEAMPRIRPGGMLLLDDSERSRYRPALNVLANWPVFIGRGLKAGAAAAVTRIWTKPSDA